jgi:hypothetical protein
MVVKKRKERWVNMNQEERLEIILKSVEKKHAALSVKRSLCRDSDKVN